MRIEGLRILDSNYYHQLTIHDGKAVVQRYNKHGGIARGCSSDKYVKSSNPISLELRGLDDDSTIERLVDYYLDYNKIIGIQENAIVGGTTYIIVSSPGEEISSIYETPNKKLRFRIVPSHDTSKKIIDRYRFDRDEFLLNLPEDIKEFVFAFETEKSYYKTDGDSAIFCLNARHDENFVPVVLDSEVSFFRKAISLVMGDNIIYDDISDEEDRFGFISREYTITDSTFSKKIKMPKELYPVAKEVVDSHNKRVLAEREQELQITGFVYQKKMEGF